VRYLTLAEVLQLHAAVISQTGGLDGLRDVGALESAVAQPRMTFGGDDLYPTLEEKAAALGFSLICNHPFLDGNKRVGHAAMETFLVLNGAELSATVEEAEQLILSIASGARSREELLTWVKDHVTPVPSRGAT
jgi:death on curing protein